MKKSLFRYLLIVLLLNSCSDLKKDKTLAFIPGTYVRSGGTEFGSIDDTISIQVQNSNVNSFLIERRWLYKRVLDGVIQEPEYKITLEQGIYDPKTKLLQNQHNLRLYSFDEKKLVLYNGTMIFQKLK